jgi:hypothetical protein
MHLDPRIATVQSYRIDFSQQSNDLDQMLRSMDKAAKQQAEKLSNPSSTHSTSVGPRDIEPQSERVLSRSPSTRSLDALCWYA